MISGENLDNLRRIQRETAEVWRSEIGAPAKIALLDFPRHDNAGDTLIWEGERAYLKALGHDVTYVADVGRLNFELLKKRIGPDGVVLLHGGGNFGDLWLSRVRLCGRTID